MGSVFFGSSTSWANMVVTASLEVLREPPKPLGFCRTKTHGEGIITTNIHKYVVNVNKAVNDIIYTWEVYFSGQIPRRLTWLLRPQRGLTHSAKATQYLPY
jgi:hypothetical protein